MAIFTPFSYRKTFLRRHIAACLRLDVQSHVCWEPPIALTDLAQQPADGQTHLTLSNFLFRMEGSPIPPLYQPVRVRHGRHGRRELPYPEADDLSMFLQRNRCEPDFDGFGIYLEAPRGTGTTTALWKAFFDCVCPVTEPPLFGYLPLWLRVETPNLNPQNTTCQELICQSLEMPSNICECLEDYLRYGPPLLILCDLSAVPLTSQRAVVNAFLAFQRQSREQKCGHCCVLAYDGANAQLSSSLRNDCFLCCTLYEWGPEQAGNYLEALAQWRGPNLIQAGQDLHNMLPCRTPLLVHILAMSDVAGTLPRRTQGQVVHQLIQAIAGSQNLRQAPGSIPDSRDALLAGTTRLALWLLYHDQVSACEPLLRQAFVSLPSTLTQQLFGNTSDSEYWTTRHDSFYYQNPTLPPGAGDAWPNFVLAQSPVIHRTGGTLSASSAVGFTTEAFRNYFAAVQGVRFFIRPSCSPISPLNRYEPHWFANTLIRLARCPSRWCGPAQLLGGVLTRDEILGLVAVYLAFAPDAPMQPHIPEVLLELLNGWAPEPDDDPILTGVLEGLQDLVSLDCLDRNPGTFESILRQRLSATAIDEIRALNPINALQPQEAS